MSPCPTALSRPCLSLNSSLRALHQTPPSFRAPGLRCAATRAHPRTEWTIVAGASTPISDLPVQSWQSTRPRSSHLTSIRDDGHQPRGYAPTHTPTHAHTRTHTYAHKAIRTHVHTRTRAHTHALTHARARAQDTRAPARANARLCAEICMRPPIRRTTQAKEVALAAAEQEAQCHTPNSATAEVVSPASSAPRRECASRPQKPHKQVGCASASCLRAVAA